MADPVVLAVVGSQWFAHPRALDWAHDLIIEEIAALAPDTLISGGCPRGIDALAERIGAEDAVRGEAYTRANGRFGVYLPANQRWEPDGYRARNDRIAAACTHLLAVRCQRSRTHGTAYTFRAARERIGSRAWLVTL